MHAHKFLRIEFAVNKEVLQYSEDTSPLTFITRPSPNAESTRTASKNTVDSARKDILATGSALLGETQITSEDPKTALEIKLPTLQNTQQDTKKSVNEPQERLSSELQNTSAKTKAKVGIAVVNTLHDDATPGSTQVQAESKPHECIALNNARTVADVSMTQRPLKSEKERAQYAFEKCNKSLSRINFHLLYLKLKENNFISAKKVRDYLANSKPDEKDRIILEAVEEAIKDTAMFNKFLKILKEQGRASDLLIKKLQKAFDE